MSRTFRKKYVPLHSGNNYERDCIEHARTVEATGRCPLGMKWYSTDYKQKAGLSAMRFLKNITRDGTKAHRDTAMMVNISRSRVKKASRVRVLLNQELKNMRAGNIDWDGNKVHPNRIRAHERACLMYDLF